MAASKRLFVCGCRSTRTQSLPLFLQLLGQPFVSSEFLFAAATGRRGLCCFTCQLLQPVHLGIERHRACPRPIARSRVRSARNRFEAPRHCHWPSERAAYPASHSFCAVIKTRYFAAQGSAVRLGTVISLLSAVGEQPTRRASAVSLCPVAKIRQAGSCGWGRGRRGRPVGL